MAEVVLGIKFPAGLSCYSQRLAVEALDTCCYKLHPSP